MSEIEIICPLYNAENYIENLNKSLLMQKDVNIKKITYALTESTDNTREILNKENMHYELIAKNDFSHSFTREQIAMNSEADILVFITQDVIIEDEKWLYFLVKDIQDGKCQASYSNQICDNNSIEKYTRELNYPKESSFVSKEDIDKLGLRTFFFSDAASAIRKDIFIKLNGYDQKRLPTNEDMYIAYKLIMNDYIIKYCAESKIVHSHSFTLKQLYRRYYDIGKFFKENKYLDKYKTTKTGGGMAKYILKRAIQDKNIKVLIGLMPNMCVRFLGMTVGKHF